MRILFVAMPDSVHAARWTKQLVGMGWDIHLFPVYDYAPPHEDLSELTFHTFSTARTARMNPTMRLAGPYPWRRASYTAQYWASRFFPARTSKAVRLASLIRRLKPDIVHSLEMQHSAYLTHEAKKILVGEFPAWLVSCWGHDLYLFGRLAEHAPKVGAVLAGCDYFTADCDRDLELARRHGFKGETFPALPGPGGFDTEMAKRLRTHEPPSARRMIALKGYQHYYGRALDGLRAIEMCADVLKGYRVVIYFPNPDISVAAELMSQRTGIEIEILPRSPYEESLKMHGRARVSVAINISDGLPNSTVEAAMMGAFPVQSDTSCVGERLRDGVGTLLVPPDNVERIAAAVRRAVTDDELVDRAAELNFRYISENLSLEIVRPRVIEMYEKIYARCRARG